MSEASVSLREGAAQGIIGPKASAVRLALKVLVVGLICHLSTEVGFAHKVPPHNISALWPTGAILFSVLVATPVRHWWAYTLAAYFTSVVNDARSGFPAAAFWFIAAGILEILIAAVGVRRFAGGLRAFDSLRSLLAYLVITAVLAPFVSAFVAAFAGRAEDYWFFWRVWLLSEGLAYLTLAPALLTCMVAAPTALKQATWQRCLEVCLIGAGLLVVCVAVFSRQTVGEGNVPTLVYLPLPLLLWAAVRFGPAGVSASLLIVACLSISGAVHGRGPFITGTANDDVLSLQLFLIAMSVPLMFLAALIEEGRRHANEVSESEARFRAMADTAPVMIWTSATDKGGDYFNRPWLNFTGRALTQELGDGWIDGIHPEDRERCLHACRAAFEARTSFEMEFRLRRRDGEYRWIIDCGVPRSAPDGSFAGYIGSCLDITERKRTELELQEQRRELAHLSRVAMLGELSGSLAHELNQPLTAILSNAQAAQRFLAQETYDLAEVRDILGDIVDADKRAGEVIRRLRALLKKGETQLQPLDLNEVTSEALALAHADFISRGVLVKSELAPGLSGVRGDRVQLQQVLLNLIVNACDAMSAGEAGQRTLTIVTSADGNGLVQVSIGDCGSGIPQETMDRLFEPFYTTKEQGLGLGLTICRSIVAAHGGRLWAVNNPVRGATFHLELPGHHGERP